ncbi:hypothetical protein Nepgr_022624 [Nepenthes gracilis]|uniref:Uncharacterized protein n=1 Tax=Nepenthes gracilis TaxID=150966 RepID=A0AAD3T1A3_NEPGR|nr:hypothetical protein Nepgr_022624 [Nepenthes gracilis]
MVSIVCELSYATCQPMNRRDPRGSVLIAHFLQGDFRSIHLDRLHPCLALGLLRPCGGLPALGPSSFSGLGSQVSPSIAALITSPHVEGFKFLTPDIFTVKTPVVVFLGSSFPMWPIESPFSRPRFDSLCLAILYK